VGILATTNPRMKEDACQKIVLYFMEFMKKGLRS